MMKSVSNIEVVKIFVQEVLGCKCPENVFEKIFFDENEPLSETCNYSIKLNVGNKLLIYILRMNDFSLIDNLLPRMINVGIEERNSSGLNRFRAVLAVGNTEQGEQIACPIFQKIAHDDKTHLHVINESEVPNVI